MQGVGSRITDADDTFLELVGRTRAELDRGELGVGDITPPEWAHVDESATLQAAATGAFTTPFDKEFVRPDGTRARATLCWSYLPGSPDQWFGYVIDARTLTPPLEPRVGDPLRLTEPQPAELYWRLAVELARERATRRAMVDNVDALIWSIDDRMRLTSANQAFLDVFVDRSGQPARIGVSMLADIDYSEALNSQRSTWRAWYARVLAGERLATRSITEYPDERRHFENVLSPIRSVDDGRVVGAACVSLDVTARVTAEQALSESEARFRTLAAAAPVGIFLIDATGLPVYMNGRGEEIYGRTLADLQGASRRDHIHPEDQPWFVPAFLAAVADGAPLESSLRIVRPDGTVRHVRVWLSPIPHDDGTTVSGFVGTIDDQTERVVLAARLAQRERLESLGTLAGGIAHDFNNVLAVVLGYADLALLESPDEPALRSCLDQIRIASLRARDMVRQILAFSRASDQSHAPIDLAALVEESVGLLRAGWPADVRCDLRRRDDPVVVIGDASALHRVVVNLCSNARDAVRDQATPQVWITIDVVGDDAVLKVTDNGPGIDPAAMARIFEPFFSTKRPGDGTGMGLAVAHGIITAHDGAITVDTGPGRGTTFCVTLPLAPAGTLLGDRTPAPPLVPAHVDLHGAAPAPSRAGARVLLVEDEPAVASVVSAALRRSGFVVEACASGEEACERVASGPDDVDVVLSDVVMPGMSGDRLAALLLRHRPDLPVLLMTGYSSTVTAEYAERLGVRALLHKPLGVDEVVAAVRAALDVPAPTIDRWSDDAARVRP
jgi:PAS domain S-box-containing protein